MSIPAVNGRISVVQHRSSWSSEETVFLLNVLRDLRVGKILEGTRQKNALLFKDVQHRMQRVGFSKSWSQIRMRWKVLKAAYLKNKRDGYYATPPSMGRYFEHVKRVLDGNPSQQSSSLVPAIPLPPPPPTDCMILPKLEITDDSNLMQEDEDYRSIENSPAPQVKRMAHFFDNENEVTVTQKESNVSFVESSYVAKEIGHQVNSGYESCVDAENPSVSNIERNSESQGPESSSASKPQQEILQKKLMSQMLSHQREMHESNQKWLSHQLELQRTWQQQCLQQQLGMIRTTVQHMTTAFTNCMQQMLNTCLSSMTSVQPHQQTFFQCDDRSRPQDDDSVSSNLFDEQSST